MADGFWVVSISRATGEASSQFVLDRDEAYQRSLDIETAETATTVVARREAPRQGGRTP
ncbi:hypothetical protein AB0876_32240 [Mycobacterium sp. NPDC049093]